MTLIGFAVMVAVAASNTILQTIVDEDKRGRATSLYMMAFMGTAPIGSLLAGGLADVFGTPWTLAVSGASASPARWCSHSACPPCAQRTPDLRPGGNHPRTLRRQSSRSRNCRPRRRIADKRRNGRCLPRLPSRNSVSNSGVRIYRIPCQVFEALSARVYLLVGAGPPTLVDAGSSLDASTQQILAGIEAVHDEFGEAVRPGDVRRIIVTHGHVDHVGGLPALVRAMPAQVAVHPLDSTAVASCRAHVVTSTVRLNAFFRRAGVDAARRGELVKMSPYRWASNENVPVGLRLEDGDELDGLRILHTPGHSPGHVCIAVGNVLLSGDHILSQTLPHLWPESAAAYMGLGHYLESLTKIERTPGIELTLAAHEQVIHDVYGRIQTIRSAHRRRLGRMLELLRKAGRPMSIDEIAQQSYPEVTSFRAVLAVTDVGSRVEYLHQRGELIVANLDEIERDENAVFRYCPA